MHNIMQRIAVAAACRQTLRLRGAGLQALAAVTDAARTVVEMRRRVEEARRADSRHYANERSVDLAMAVDRLCRAVAAAEAAPPPAGPRDILALIARRIRGRATCRP